jgi:hypothetical protein
MRLTQAGDDLAEAVEAAFHDHPDAGILLSFPGLGVQLAARILAEIGDDHTRFADARGLKAYAGSASITRASGKKHYVGRRMVKNNRLIHAGFLWAFAHSAPRPARTPTPPQAAPVTVTRTKLSTHARPTTAALTDTPCALSAHPSIGNRLTSGLRIARIFLHRTPCTSRKGILSSSQTA